MIEVIPVSDNCQKPTLIKKMTEINTDMNIRQNLNVMDQ